MPAEAKDLSEDQERLKLQTAVKVEGMLHELSENSEAVVKFIAPNSVKAHNDFKLRKERQNTYKFREDQHRPSQR